ncbi:hypothetical protein EVAR_16802_1 [Eumeta japonica]|uniref:Uncharacterized protein n=1 Tax=Eumeta variegata TaxID=151549 RepID=A0A4C1UL00_EUMVA|nr:hypothetical protein EVAR_16802_1 [Eumeta japonica]
MCVRTHAHARRRAHARTHARMRARTHARTHTRMHAHTHIRVCVFICIFLAIFIDTYCHLADRVEGDRCSTNELEPTTRASLAERDIERNGTMTSTFSCMQPVISSY